MDNYQIYETEQKLKQIIIDSGLPPAVLYYVLDKMTEEIYNLYMQTVQQEIARQQQISDHFKDDVSEMINETINNEEAPQAGQE